MKTRITYPQLWHDANFCECSSEAQLLALFLVTNPYLGLSRYTRISDRQYAFHLNIKDKKLSKAKEELQQLRWFFFVQEWVYHNHSIAYVDYEGRDRVQTSKEQEIKKVPQVIKEVINGLITGYEPVLNHKSKTINQKQGESAERGITAALPEERGKSASGYKHIEDLTQEDFEEIAVLYQVTVPFVLSKLDDMKNWMDKTGKSYKNYKAALKDWVKRDALERKEKHGKGNVAFYPESA